MNPQSQSKNWPVHATAFLSGLAVMVIEIGGARALAPFFGSSLQVWTAQITATLLFLALGYRAGAWLASRESALALPGLFWTAGLWLCAYALMRTAVLRSCAASFSVATGSFLSASVLFGLPLMALGAVSPVLIAKLRDQGAGQAAGSLFFTGTLGSLLGGWITALVLIPSFSLRHSLGATGLSLLALGLFWGLKKKTLGAKSVLPVLLAVVMLAASPRAVGSLSGPGRALVRVLYNGQSSVGLLQVLDFPETSQRTLLIDGVTQGGMDTRTGRSFLQFTESMNYFSHLYHPGARSALLLGLGTGMLAKELDERGLQVTVAELEPKIEKLARLHFGLPGKVRVSATDGRAYLARTQEKFDLVFLDVFAGESTPFYLLTRECMALVKSRLNPGGRLIINSITRKGGSTPGQERMETVVAGEFSEGLLFIDQGEDAGSDDLTNAILVAGEGLKPEKKEFPGLMQPELLTHAGLMARSPLPVKARGRLLSDESSDLDLAESRVRLDWRRALMSDMGPDFLGD